MTGWTPLYQQIVGSSVWGAPDHVRLAWITLLAVANKQGVAAITEGGLARLAVISRENAADALRVLSSPDPDTLTQENEGRRIERVENGWKLLNFLKYREAAKSEALREANRQAQEKWRAAQKDKEESSTENNAEGKPKFSKPGLEEVKLAAAKVGLSDEEAEKFWNYYESNGWRVGRNPMKSLGATMAGWKLRNKGNGESPAPVDDFWKDSKRLELVEKGIKEIEARASHTAMDMIVEPRDAERYGQLKSERKQLKEKMKL